ncbi:hypothetical protein A7A08_01273 [Methyloligella halotolerans]|uniref:Uncharacterized protein n=1 Tax=Methyloligella halotolerans TaxID=1177755 RepID=A0A1E2S0S0_9HYPH|nr:hypothetical protein [Methyloligella halotolerans]ODA68103.1 hypothetical protein A7A08_01273 [Methyloligella halotolerans]
MLKLGSKTDIRIPKGATSATIDLIGNADQKVTFETRSLGGAVED